MWFFYLEVDTCLENDVCDQLCVNGSLACDCHEDYLMNPATRECKAKGEEQVICAPGNQPLTTIKVEVGFGPHERGRFFIYANFCWPVYCNVQAVHLSQTPTSCLSPCKLYCLTDLFSWWSTNFELLSDQKSSWEFYPSHPHLTVTESAFCLPFFPWLVRTSESFFLWWD